MARRDPIARKAYAREYYLRNRETVKSRSRKYHETHRDEILVKQHIRYEEKKEERARKARMKRAADPEAARAKDREQYEKKIQKNPELNLLRYQREKEKRKEKARRYAKDHPDKRADAQQRRRARKKGAPSEKVTRAEILRRDGPCCAFCGIETTQPIHLKSAATDRHYDHIVPLKRGGHHSMKNMRILCAKCNISKKDRLDNEWPRRLGGQDAVV